MKDNVKEMLKRYDNLVALILEQKIDEYSDMLDQVPPDEDTATYEEYIRKAAQIETEKATAELEDEPDETLDGKSLRDVFEEMSFDELKETLEYCALNLDRGVPQSLIDSMATMGDSDRVRSYVAETIGDTPWSEEELKDPDKVFEIEFQKVKACFKVLIRMEEPAFLAACLEHFMSYPVVRDFVADSLAEYIEAFPEVSVPMLIDELEKYNDEGLPGPCEDLVILLSRMGKVNPSEDIYQALRHAFRYMNNKIYAVICLGDYGDPRAIPMFKNYINRNQDTISRELFYEMMSAIQNLGGDISDINDPFGDFQKKKEG
ncbi:MAG: hypothetical protein J5786_06350 [Clostridiales bacterium]|nr:hypothetical protein [Clostridiales bacterium]